MADMAASPDFDLMRPLGVTGLRQWSGYIDEEFLAPLRGPRRFRIYAEMHDNEPLLAASLLAIELLIKQVQWSVEPVSNDPAAEQAAQFARECLFDDMALSWHSTLSEILSMLVYGWSTHEILYKRRQGDQRDPQQSSRFTDGKIGWAGFEIRSQDTLQRWLFDEQTRQLIGLEQRPWGGYLGSGLIQLPLEKLLLFRLRAHKDNPEGVSMLRSAYVPWYHKARIRELQGIGVERDLVGLPVLYCDPRILDGRNGQYSQQYNAYKKMIQNLRVNENHGVLLPHVETEHGNKLYELTLLSARGQTGKQFDTVAIVEQLNMELVIALFTDLLLLGHEQVGSFALASSKTTLLATAIGAILDTICDVINRQALPRLWRLNAMPLATLPHLAHGDVEAVDIGELSQGVLRLSQAGLDPGPFAADIWRRVGFQSAESVQEDV